jgi:hypothetical protein
MVSSLTLKMEALRRVKASVNFSETEPRHVREVGTASGQSRTSSVQRSVDIHLCRGDERIWTGSSWLRIELSGGMLRAQ